MWPTIAIMAVALATVQCYITREDNRHSSTFHIVENYMLKGYSFHKQSATSMLECSRVCLREDRCWSFNYYCSGIDANCELNTKNASAVEQWNFVYFEDCTYGALVDPEVDPSPVPPVIDIKPKSVIAEEKLNATLDCTATGIPSPTISWSKSNGELPSRRSLVMANNSLVITDIKRDDKGVYVCTARNRLGRDTAHGQLTVLPAMEFTVKPMSTVEGIKGQRIVLSCHASNALEVVWQRNNKSLGDSIVVHSNGTVVIPNASPQDSDLYTCMARNILRSINTNTSLTIYSYPKSCSELKSKIPTISSGNYVIDPDGQSANQPITVYCNMTDKGGMGVTVVSHDSENRTLVDGYAHAPGSYSKNVSYNGASMAQLAKLTEISNNCEQFIQVECNNDVTFLDAGYGWWVSRDGVRQNYWGGATPGSKKCACGMTNTCKITSQGCNCNNRNNTIGWTSDSGLLTNKSTLPVSQIRLGDTDQDHEQAYHTLGKLKCYG